MSGYEYVFKGALSIDKFVKKINLDMKNNLPLPDTRKVALIIMKYFENWRSSEVDKFLRKSTNNNDLVSLKKFNITWTWEAKKKFIQSICNDYETYLYVIEKKEQPFSRNLEEFKEVGIIPKAKTGVLSLGGVTPIYHPLNETIPETSYPKWINLYKEMLSIDFLPLEQLVAIRDYLIALVIFYDLIPECKKISFTALLRMETAAQKVLFLAGQKIAEIDRHGRRELDRIFKINKSKRLTQAINIEKVCSIFDERFNDASFKRASDIEKARIIKDKIMKTYGYKKENDFPVPETIVRYLKKSGRIKGREE